MTLEFSLKVAEIDGSVFELIDEHDIGSALAPGQQVGVVLEEACEDDDPETSQVNGLEIGLLL